jgi:hypothetical protein
VLIIGAPIAGLLYVIYTRVMLELVMAVFRMMETNTELVALQRSAAGAPPAPASGGGPSYSSPPPTDPPPYPPPVD